MLFYVIFLFSNLSFVFIVFIILFLFRPYVMISI
ncbi:hypothetical protein Leryth_026394 [Lithospermum erythrorhizon]|nr:hypothetical protein Leryth_026394 [Lithospermum erythrorhizon]